jgi:DnaK suppressor protein
VRRATISRAPDLAVADESEKRPMKQANVERLRQKLEFQRHEAQQFLRRMEHEAKSLDVEATPDSADRCLISMSKESLFERSSQRRTVLRLIEAALKRISDGSFGICVACDEEIQDQRLQALPWTQFCLRCQRELEEKVGPSLTKTSIPATAASRLVG